MSNWLKKNQTIRRLGRSLRLRYWGHPRWDILRAGTPDERQWTAARAAASDSRSRVLIALNVGSHLPATVLESLLAVALTLRGARVEFVLCDGVLPACLACDSTLFSGDGEFLRRGPQGPLCGSCFQPARRMLEQMGFKVHRLSEWLHADDRTQAKQQAAAVNSHSARGWKLDGVAVGEHALAGTLRYYARASLEGEPWGEAVLRRYLESSWLTMRAYQRLLGAGGYQSAIIHHGIYAPQGIAAEVCRAQGVRVVTWNPAYRKNSFIFSHGETYHHTLMTEPVATWESVKLTEAQQKATADYLLSRAVGSHDWITFQRADSCRTASQVAERLGLDLKRPCVVLLTNVMWDAQLHYPANAFPDMLAWIIETIRYFAIRPDLQLVIRVHPAELRGSLVSRQPVVAEIRKLFPDLPANIHLVGPESELNTYAIAELANAVIIYGTKTGVELATLGLPIIVAGEAWIRGKGIAVEASTRADYLRILADLPITGTVDPATKQRALLYAYHFFFRRMIPLQCVEKAKGHPPYRLSLRELDALLPGRDRGLDVICEGILQATPFIYPAETLA